MDYLRILDDIFSQFSCPAFATRLWDGKTRTYGNEGTPEFTLVINDEKTARRLVREGALGFGESYMDGSLDIEGDLEAYMRTRHQFKYVKPSLELLTATLLSRLTSPFTRSGHIAKHYDLGNDFFALFLDTETMSYSAGLYTDEKDTLEIAQRNKLSYVHELLALPPEARVLDLGSGWGGFMKSCVQRNHYVDGYTLSKAQLTFVQNMIREEGAGKHASVSYQDMTQPFPKGTYDAVVSIESIEHVGRLHLSSFFRNVHQALKLGGQAYIQATGRYAYRAVDPWTLKYVFPGGYLPTKDELIRSATQAGFTIAEFRDDTDDYIRTMTEWIQRLEKNQETIERMFDSEFYRLWKLWMHGAKVAFELNSMSLFRMHIRKK
ncbi:MAG: class I SAM-dependent methyltransferase [Candidatus Pacebacteria bacterium]|nr:class I SAM-dependent methyltransferase [Candidatus Paceibacterota bacterium]